MALGLGGLEIWGFQETEEKSIHQLQGKMGEMQNKVNKKFKTSMLSMECWFERGREGGRGKREGKRQQFTLFLGFLSSLSREFIKSCLMK